MDAYLDERFPTLAAVSELVDGEAARIEGLQQTRKTYRAQLAAEARERHAQHAAQTERRVRAAIAYDSAPADQFPAETAERIAAIRGLTARRRVLELALAAATYLQAPDANTDNLLAVVAALGRIDSDELAGAVRRQLVQEWWEPRMAHACAGLRSVLAAAGWPRATPPPGSASVRDALRACIDLDAVDDPGLRTFAVLAEPLGQRIAFNFRPGQDTAREDRPEWLFGYVLKLVDPHAAWLRAAVQPLAAQPLEHLFRALCPSIVATLQATFVLDAHFVDELLGFAAAVETRWWVSRATINASLITVLLDAPTLNAYLASELAARRAALRDILAPRSGLHATDFDADVPCAKPPFSAENSWQLVARSLHLLPLGPELVAAELQAPLVELMLEFWDSSLSAYTHAHSSLARAVGSAHSSPDRLVLPEMPDLDFLSQIYGAAAYFEVNLTTLGSQLAIVHSGWAVADEAAKFQALRTQAAQKIASLLAAEAQKHLRPYLQLEWREPEDHAHRLRAAIDGLAPRLAVVAQLCSSSRADHARILVAVSHSLAEVVWRIVINANVFTADSAAALRADITELWARWSLPANQPHARNIAATRFLETGELEAGLLPAEAEGLRRRRV